jgi:hypothetical protein
MQDGWIHQFFTGTVERVTRTDKNKQHELERRQTKWIILPEATKLKRKIRTAAQDYS